MLIHSDEKKYNVELLTYGLEVIGATWGKTLVLLLVGICTGYLTETAIVLLVFCGLRSQAGGWHCKTSWGCSMIMISTIYGSILLGKFVKLPVFFLMFCLIFYACLLYKFAPYSTVNHPISDKIEIKRRKRKSILVLSLIMIAEIVVEDWQIREIIFFACSIEVFSVVSLKGLKAGRIDSMSDEELDLLAPWNEEVNAEIERQVASSNQ